MNNICDTNRLDDYLEFEDEFPASDTDSEPPEIEE